MNYYSTNKISPVVSFKEAAIQGQAPDKGLYFPEKIAQFDAEFIQSLKQLSDAEIAYHVLSPYVGDDIGADNLRSIVAETVNFPMPLVPVTDTISSLELFHGPTLAFKDVGARFMSRCLGYFLQNENRQVTVLVATSGDTGGAVAAGFYNVVGVNVIILYPSGMVSPVQEKQLTALGNNITALEVSGTFDDCQAMVKQAFTDVDLNEKHFLTSANSINVARWLPQQIYYFLAIKQWKKQQPPVVSVPSGNFGNICAGILAMQSGLPIKHFIAACNINNIVEEYLATQIIKTKTAVATLSNAMDVGNPSNFVRILEIFNNDFADLKSKLSSYTISDAATQQTIGDVFKANDYLLDPHGSVGFAALQKYQSEQGQNADGIFLATAHPVKFPQSVESVIGQKIEIPDTVKEIMAKEKQSIKIAPSFAALKEYLLNH